MARWRLRHWRFRAIVSLGALLVIMVVVLVWPSGDGASSDESPAVLSGTRPADADEVGSKPMVPPAKDTPNMPPAVPPLVVEEKSALNPTGALTSQPALSQPPAANRSQGRRDFEAGMKAWQQNDPLAARTHLNRALRTGLPRADAKRARETLAEAARKTLFTRAVVKGETLAGHHVVKKGDALIKIAKQFRVSEDFLAELNGLANKHFIREGMRLKVVHGPFHAAISKSDHLMHIYVQDVYVRTYRVALGMNGNTPTGKWKVTDHLKNPSWTDPQTGKRWHADDQDNPLGEYWIKLEGIEGDAEGQFGYGIHGTIEPETIGKDVSMGCVRLAPKDIAEVYKLLVPGASLVTISD